MKTCRLQLQIISFIIIHIHICFPFDALFRSCQKNQCIPVLSVTSACWRERCLHERSIFLNFSISNIFHIQWKLNYNHSGLLSVQESWKHPQTADVSFPFGILENKASQTASLTLFWYLTHCFCTFVDFMAQYWMKHFEASSCCFFSIEVLNCVVFKKINRQSKRGQLKGTCEVFIFSISFPHL